MSKIQAVIGANYGDEGKGLVTDYLCGKALKEKKSCIVILGNGGAQRGHTVETEDGKRFVFHHLGSGSLLGVGSYFCQDYIMNPVVFHKDWQMLLNLIGEDSSMTLPHLYTDPTCRFSTPYDMISNQIQEDLRGEQRHGSVGLGIWETVRRYEKGYGISLKEMRERSRCEQMEHLRSVREYMRERIFVQTGKYPEEMSHWKEIWSSEELMHRYLDDFADMCQLIQFGNITDLAKYDILVIENAQGLLLGQKQYNGKNHTTPSDTGALEVKRLLQSGLDSLADEIELYYVTRTYLTKHGAGDFEGECDKSDINKNMKDLTNVPNAYQGTIRYGRICPARLIDNIMEDVRDLEPYPFQTNLVITHANEYPAEDICAIIKENKNFTTFLSDGPVRNSVQKI